MTRPGRGAPPSRAPPAWEYSRPDEPDPQPPSLPATRWPAVAALILSGMLAAAQIGKVPPALPVLRHDLALGLITAGWVASLFSVTGATLGIVSGAIADRLGRRRLLLAGLAALALGSLLGSLSGGGAGLLVSRAIEGLGFVAIVVAAPALIAEAAPAQHRLTLSLWSSYMPTGVAAMMLLTPPALAWIGWRGLWAASAGVILLFLPLAAYLTRPRPDQRPRPRARSPAAALPPGPGLRDFRAALARPGPWLLGLCFTTYTLQWSAVMAWLPTFIIGKEHTDLARAVVLTALVVFANVPGTQFGGWLLGRGVARWRLLAASPLCMAALALGMFATTLPDPAKYVMAIAFSGLGGVLPAACLSGVPAHARRPQEIGLVTGMLVQGANLGSLCGPPLIAALVAALGDFERAGLALPVAAALGLILALGVRAVERRQARERQALERQVEQQA